MIHFAVQKVSRSLVIVEIVKGEPLSLYASLEAELSPA
jgi:hypothetical protein